MKCQLLAWVPFVYRTANAKTQSTMSSRPMGWSETGTDRMCKLRCFIRNYGREKVIDLVNYRRERELSVAAATGTDGMIDESQRKRYTAKQKEAQRYAEALHVTLSGSSTVRKILAIREQIGNIWTWKNELRVVWLRKQVYDHFSLGIVFFISTDNSFTSSLFRKLIDNARYRR